MVHARLQVQMHSASCLYICYDWRASSSWPAVARAVRHMYSGNRDACDEPGGGQGGILSVVLHSWMGVVWVALASGVCLVGCRSNAWAQEQIRCGCWLAEGGTGDARVCDVVGVLQEPCMHLCWVTCCWEQPRGCPVMRPIAGSSMCIELWCRR
jgi:hypothetical protein